MRRSKSLKAHSQRKEDKMVIQEDQDGDLGLVMTKLIYIIGPTLKQSPKLKPYYSNPRNPTTVILGMSNCTSR